MENPDRSNEFSKDVILQDVIEILGDMTVDWDIDFDGPIGFDTRLIADLAFESIDVVQFIVAIEEQFKRRGLPFEELLMIEGRYVDELKVSDTVEFLYQQLNL